MYSSETNIRVRYADTDKMGVVYHSNYLIFFETGRTEAFRQLGYEYRELEKTGIIMPVVEVQLRYLKPAFYDDLLTVKTMLKDFPRHHKVDFYNEIYNAKNELLVTGKVTLFLMEAATMTRTRFTDDILNTLQPFFETRQ